MTIEARNLVKRYPEVEALYIKELRIEVGETIGLVGNNGAGKTTFLRLVLDLIQPTEGQVLINGQNVGQRFDWKRDCGAFLDESFLIDYLTPEEFFIFVGQCHGLAKEETLNRLSPFSTFFAGEILGKKRLIRDLSQGNKKKTGIAAALIPSPKIIILDEPFANLDPSSQIRLKNILRQVASRDEITLIVSSHELNHITEVCNRITVLDNGRIVHDLETSQDTLVELQEYFTVEDGEVKKGDFDFN